MMKQLLIHGHLIADGNREFLDGALLLEEDRILEVYPQSSRIPFMEDCEILDLGGNLLMPGFFDTHAHGIEGLSFDHCSREELDHISHLFAADGTTSFLASLSYDLAPEGLGERFALYEDYRGPCARFEGLHLEGPYLSRKHLGVGDPDKFLEPDIETVRCFLKQSSCIRQMTIAYELPGAKAIGQLLHDHGIRVMCGHSDAVYEDLDENVDGFTHLFNAMRSLHHRDITLVNCAFLNRWQCELIADGNHVKANVLKLVLNNIDRERIMLVTDSSIARNLPDGEYDFLSKPCTKKGTTFITFDGHFAGSVVSIPDEMKVLSELGAKYTDLLLYSSLNAFRFYGLEKQYGTLAKGKHADLVVLDEQLNVRRTHVQGGWIDV